MRSLLALSASLLCAVGTFAQNVGDAIMSVKGTNGLVPVTVTKTPNRVIGWDGSGNLVPVTQATPTWGNINGSLTDQEDLREALADKLSINAATGLYQPLNAQLSAIGALSTTAFGRGLLTAADAAAARTAQGLGTLATQNGTLTDYLLITTAAATYQPLSEQLTLFSEIPHTPFGRALLNVADAEALRTAAEVPEIATQEAAETGESNTSLMTPLRTAQAIAALGGGGGGGDGTNVQEFTANGDWTNPSPSVPKRVRIVVIGAGGGGGSGRKGAVDAAAGGGGGGAGGAFVESWATTTEFGATEAVTVGVGGAGGSSINTAATNGQPGTTGGSSTALGFTALGGFHGQAGSTAGGVGGTARTGGCCFGLLAPINSTAAANGGAATPTGSNAAGVSFYLPTGGGGGGGYTSVGAVGSGGNGGAVGTAAIKLRNGGVGGNPNSSTPPTAGTSAGGVGLGGGGGGTNQSGANGGFPGGGGGGGGAGGNIGGLDSGAGGNGGDGYVLIITY